MNREDSGPTLEVSSFGVVDGSGHYLEHTAVVPQKARVLADGDCAVVIRPESETGEGNGRGPERAGNLVSNIDTEEVQGGTAEGHNLDEPMTEEVTAVTKAPRRASGSGLLRSLAFVETNRTTILILSIGVLLLFFALGLRFRS